PEMAEIALRLQRLARTQAAFATAVDAWMRHRRVPRARQLLAFMQFAEGEVYLTEDERSFVKQAPLQKLRGLKRGLNLTLASSGGAALLLAAGAWAHQTGWLILPSPAETLVALSPARASKSDDVPKAPAAPEQPQCERQAVIELENSLNTSRRELEG